MSKLKIEKILIKNGYKLTHGLGYYSSIIPGGVCSTYSKGGHDVFVGLQQKGFPPSLIRPRPAIKESNYQREMYDGEVIGWIEKSSDEEIIKFIEKQR